MSGKTSHRVAIVGCGFVADLYMASFKKHPEVSIVGVYDRNLSRQEAFCRHWNLRGYSSYDALLSSNPDLVLNLTNPAAHYDISRAALSAGLSVYSEKPLATEMADACALVALAKERGVLLGSAPCSVLGETAQTFIKAVRDGAIGPVRLVYAELDDDYIPQAAYRSWFSASGAPWPFEDEFRVGCTLEHAGYYLTWLIAAFGPVEKAVAASAAVIPGKVTPDTDTPDVSVAMLFFKSGVICRLTCSIVAPHNHQLRAVGDHGVLEINEAWNNNAPVKFRKRLNVRRRLVYWPVAKRLRLNGPTHPKVGRTGAGSMNFALGPVEMLEAQAAGRACRLSAEFALHVNEVTLAIQNAGATTGPQSMVTDCARPAPMEWAT